MDVSERGGCLKFSYHFFGLAEASFLVEINNQKSATNGSILWAQYIPQSTGWTEAQIHIPKQNDHFYIVFKAHLNPKYKHIIGLDDIIYSSYPCKPLQGAKNDFESKNEIYTLDGATIATGGKPINDHTTNSAHGHFALSSSKNPSTVIASIENLTYSSTKSEYYNCLKFYYQFIAHKFDNDADSYLDVSVTNMTYVHKRIHVKEIFSENFENEWQLFLINIPITKRASTNANLTISMNTFHSTQIAIDDILIEDRPCQENYDCDFESGMFAEKFTQEKVL